MDDIGRQAFRPSQIPPEGWKFVLRRAVQQVFEDHVNLIAAGSAFFAFLAIFPGITAIISITAMFTDPSQIGPVVAKLRQIVPPDVVELIETQMSRILENRGGGTLAFATIFSVLFALWSANKGMKNFIKALSITQGEKVERNILKHNLVSLVLTVCLIAAFIMATGIIAIIPTVRELAGVGQGGFGRFAEWSLLLGLVMGLAMVVYRYGPDRHKPRWAWTWPGALVSTLIWLAVSWLFSVYVQNFGNFNKVYGSLAAVIALLMWFYLTAFIFLIGSEINAELERQTRRDSTADGSQPIGERNAYPADTVAPVPGHDNGREETKPINEPDAKPA